MNISKFTITSLILAIATYASLSFGAVPNQGMNRGTSDLTNAALGFCEMNTDQTKGAAVFPDNSIVKGTNCSEILKVAAEKGYSTILSTTASTSVSSQSVASFVIAADSAPKPTAVVSCSSAPVSDQQPGAVDYSDGKHVKEACGAILHDLKAEGYSIVPELTVSSGALAGYTSYVFVKK